MARQPTSPAVKAARAAVEQLKQRTPRMAPQLDKHVMVYLLEVRVPVESVSDFESEHLEDSLTQYGSVDVIDRAVVVEK